MTNPEYPTVNTPEYLDKGFGCWWHEIGKRAIKLSEVEDE